VTRYITLAEYFCLAEQITGTNATVLVKASRSDLADSALHAPMAGFGDKDFYPDLYDKAAVLTCRLAWNHPLPDGNKRAAWAALLMFVDLNGGVWTPDPPDVHDAYRMMMTVAAGEGDESDLADGSELASLSCNTSCVMESFGASTFGRDISHRPSGWEPEWDSMS
jgi:death-on-curing protein